MGQSQPPDCIVDANIIFDLYRGGMLPILFELPLRFAAPDAVIAELLDPAGAEVEVMGLQRLLLNSGQLSQVIVLSRDHVGVSASDIQAFVLARDWRAILLTGDKYLRRIADDAGISVHGTLWVLDEMIKAGILTPTGAAAALHAMLDRGSRLPPEECEDRFKEWKIQP